MKRSLLHCISIIAWISACNCFRFLNLHSTRFATTLSVEWKASPEEEAALAKMLQRSTQQRKKLPGTAAIQTRSSPVQRAVTPVSPSVSAAMNSQELQARPLYKPNSEWRNAIDNPYRPKKSTLPNEVRVHKPTPSKEERLRRQQLEDEYEDDEDYDDDGEDFEDDEDDELQFTYEDLEYAMQLLDSGQIDGAAGKYGTPEEIAMIYDNDYSLEEEEGEYGLFSGEVLDTDIFTTLSTLTGEKLSYASLVNNTRADIMVLYVHARRYETDFKNVIQQLERIPKNKNMLCIRAVTRSELPDIRKLLKKQISLKQEFTIPIAFDTTPTRQFVTALGCLQDTRLLSALALIDIRTRQLIRIWYEGKRWEVSKTQSMILDAVEEYRDDPDTYFDKYIR